VAAVAAAAESRPQGLQDPPDLMAAQEMMERPEPPETRDPLDRPRLNNNKDRLAFPNARLVLLDNLVSPDPKVLPETLALPVKMLKEADKGLPDLPDRPDLAEILETTDNLEVLDNPAISPKEPRKSDLPAQVVPTDLPVLPAPEETMASQDSPEVKARLVMLAAMVILANLEAPEATARADKKVARALAITARRHEPPPAIREKKWNERFALGTFLLLITAVSFDFAPRKVQRLDNLRFSQLSLSF